MAIAYKTDWEFELERRERLGITDAPPPLPHPDHIEIDLRAHTVRIVGPMSKQEKAVCDLWVAQKQELVAKIEKLQEELESAKTSSTRKKLEKQIYRTMADLGETLNNPPEIGIG